MNNIWILAAAGDDNSEGELVYGDTVTDQQATQEVTTQDAPNGAAADQPKRPAKPLIPFWAMIGLMVLMMYMLMFRPKQKQQKQHARMLNELKKNDRVRTVGGIFGTVVDVRDDEITLKVDESNNTKIKVSSGSIGKVLSDENA